MFALLITKLEKSLNGPFVVIEPFKVIILRYLKRLHGNKPLWIKKAALLLSDHHGPIVLLIAA